MASILPPTTQSIDPGLGSLVGPGHHLGSLQDHAAYLTHGPPPLGAGPGGGLVGSGGHSDGPLFAPLQTLGDAELRDYSASEGAPRLALPNTWLPPLQEHLEEKTIFASGAL